MEFRRTILIGAILGLIVCGAFAQDRTVVRPSAIRHSAFHRSNTKNIEQTLDLRIDVDFSDTPLHEAVTMIQEAVKIPISIDSVDRGRSQRYRRNVGRIARSSKNECTQQKQRRTENDSENRVPTLGND